jgi:hypothetical protein
MEASFYRSWSSQEGSIVTSPIGSASMEAPAPKSGNKDRMQHHWSCILKILARLLTLDLEIPIVDLWIRHEPGEPPVLVMP